MNNKKPSIIYQNFHWLILGLLCFLLIIPKFQLISVAGTYVNIRIEDFVVAAVYCLWSIGWLKGYFSIKKIFNLPIIIFYLTYGLTITLLGIFTFKTVNPWHLGILHWLRRVEYLGMYLIAASVLKRENLKKYLYVLLIIGVVIWVYGVLQWKDLVPGVHTLSKSGQLGTYEELGYVISTFAAHYDFGAFLILMTLLSWWGYFSHSARKLKLFFLVLVTAFWWMALLAYARAAYLGLLVGSIVFLVVKLSPWVILPIVEIFNTFSRYLGGKFSLYSYDLKLKREAPVHTQPLPVPSPTPHIKPTVSLSPTPKATLTPTGQPIPPLTFRHRLDNIVDSWSRSLNQQIGSININLDPSANIRLQEWPEKLAKINYHFLWGGGYYAGGLGLDNDYLRHLIEVGVFGLSVFLLVLFDFIRSCWRNYHELTNPAERNFQLVIITFIIGLLVEAAFIDIFAASKVAFMFWFLMGLTSVYEQKRVTKNA